MEVKFDRDICPYLKNAVCQLQQQEQTQEVKLPEAMPDIGRILCCRGQVLIRSKEWRGSSAAVSGGVMAWVLYIPEDGGDVRSVEAWVPFQMRWEFPQAQRDGTVVVSPLIKSMDARATSARKMMVRCEVQILGQALEPTQAQVCLPAQLPEDVQLRTEVYPVKLPVEAGEKLLQLEQELPVASGAMLYCNVIPEVIEQKVMAGRLVFRGTAAVHGLCMGANGQPETFDAAIPFSQYTELDKTHSTNADSRMDVVLTALELESVEEGNLVLKASAAAQYVISDRTMLKLPMDAYSRERKLALSFEPMELPAVLDEPHVSVCAAHTADIAARQILDAAWQPHHGICSKEEDSLAVSVPGQFSLLYFDEEGLLQAYTQQAKGVTQMPCQRENQVSCCLLRTQKPDVTMLASGVELTAQTELCVPVSAGNRMEMISGLELGEPLPVDENRPSLILQRAGDETLWDIAKACGSTVEAIQKANALQQDPEKGRMLLIPIP